MNLLKGVACGSMALLSMMATAQKSEPKPNVIMLVVDDWNDMIGAFGGNQAITPNIDKLCAEGVAFTHSYAAATFCTPSRTSLMTGVAPWKSGCYANQPQHYNMPERKSISTLFQENDYKVYGGGKVYHHMPGFVDLRGYDEYFHWNPAQKKRGWGLFAWRDNAATPKEIPASDFGKTVYTNFDIAAIPNELEKEMADTKMIDWALDIVKEEHDKPFFLSAGLYTPHKPNFAPQKYFDLYPIEDIQLPPIQENDTADLAPYIQNFLKGKANHTHNKLITIENGWKRAIQGYLAAISYADAQLGRLLDELSKSPNAENTIIVFWSDNGYHLGEKYCWAKHTLWERTANVPMIWAGPGIKKNKQYHGAVSLLDIYPTLVEQCGLKGSQELDGESITGILEKPGKLVDRTIVTAGKNGDDFSVFTNEWHYINYKFGRAEELYSVTKDNHEWNNLVLKEEYKSVIEDLKQAIPTNPAKPSLQVPNIRLVCEGESFKWVKSDGKKGKRKNKK
ncbi:iduronate sulfatase [Puteibacter caeruleilacunae]|nr:iduronate sulfatase [Puteibacter caeruleilacunae]